MDRKLEPVDVGMGVEEENTGFTNRGNPKDRIASLLNKKVETRNHGLLGKD